MSGKLNFISLPSDRQEVVFPVPRLDRQERPFEPTSKPPGPLEDGGPRQPDVGSPDKENLLKRMRKVDPKQAERYRQRTGE